MATSSRNEAPAYSSRVRDVGMEAALREAGCSEQTMLETLSLVEEDLFKKQFIVSAQVRKLLEGWSRKNSLIPVLNLDEFYKLCQENSKLYEVSWDALEIVLADLNNSRVIKFSKNTDFIVTNPSWFEIDLSSNVFKRAEVRRRRSGASRMENELHHSHGFVERQDIESHLERSTNDHLMQFIPVETSIDSRIDLMIKLGMCFQNHGREEELFIPALFDDNDEIAAESQRQLKWSLIPKGPLEYLGRRLECLNKSTRSFPRGFFPRLQVHLRNYIHEKGWTANICFALGRNLICFAESGVEVLVEYAGHDDKFIDILVRSSQSYAEALKFIKKHVVKTIHTFCDSPQGWQGVYLVESVIRPVCVRELLLCIERKAHSVLVSVLEDRLAEDNGYIYTWSHRIGYASDTDRALDLLEGEGSYERIRSKRKMGLVQDTSNSTAPVSSFANATPSLIYPIIMDTGVVRRLETGLNMSKVISIKLHILCDHKDGCHKVEGQRGRTVKLNDVQMVKLALRLLWAGVGAGASMVGASVVVPLVDNWIKRLFTVPEMPNLDHETIYQMMNPGHPGGPVSEKEILKALENYWACDPNMESMQLLKEILKLDDARAFCNDFNLYKVIYTEADHENRIGWVCERHLLNGLRRQTLRSELHWEMDYEGKTC